MILSSNRSTRNWILLGIFQITWLFLIWEDTIIGALWPSLLAITAVLLTHRVISGLLLGAFAGAILIAGGNPFLAFESLFTEHLIPSLQSKWNVSVVIFTLVLGGFVALLERGGGFQALFSLWMRNSTGIKKKVQWSAFLLGIICFFDGLANAMLVGRSITPMAKQAGVSRQKLSYIVDSTGACIACIAIISTWIAYQLSMIREGYAQAGIPDAQPFTIFIQSIPLNFYCWFTLILLVVVIARNWNIGPMKTAETEARAFTGDTRTQDSSAQLPAAANLWRTFIPLLVLIASLLLGLYFDGAETGPLSLDSIAQAFGNADAAKIMVLSSIVSALVAFLLNYKPVQQSGTAPVSVFQEGALKLFIPTLILVAAWTLSSTLKTLGTADMLGSLLTQHLSPTAFPVLVFIAGTLISFTTGTSWGTMGVLMPLALPVAIEYMALESAGGLPLDSFIVAAVFSGAVFGDHCSPLSDTTIVSSMACEIDPLDHVRTQIPYALIAAVTAALVGFLPTGFGMSPWISLILGAAILVTLPILFKQKTTS